MRNEYDGWCLWDRVYTTKPVLCNNNVIVPAGSRGHIVQIDDDGMYLLVMDNLDYARCEVWVFGKDIRFVKSFVEAI